MSGGRVSKWHVGVLVFALCLCIPTLLVSANEKTDAPTPKIELVAVGSFWLPDISTIGEELIPPPFGACCGAPGPMACTNDANQTWCENNGGIYMGHGTVCGGGMCSTPVREVTWGHIKALYR
jgi:hypothetical protein